MSVYTKEEQIKLIKSNIHNLKLIDNQYEDICGAVVTMKGMLLEDVKKQTHDICLAAVKNDGYALMYVKEQSYDICLEAVKKNGKSLRYVKEQTNELCLEAVKQDGEALEYVQNQTDEICLEAVKQEGRVLKYVENQTNEICLEAVKQAGSALRYVKNQTPEICLQAVKTFSKAINYVNTLNEDICFEAIKTDGDLIENIDFKTPKICFYAFLNKFKLNKYKYIKNGMNSFIMENPTLENNIFCINRFVSYSNILKKNNITNYNIVDLDIESMLHLNNYVINSSYNNYFIISNTLDIDESILKSIAVSNNQLILVNENDDKIKNIHKLLSNEILKVKELKNFVF